MNFLKNRFWQKSIKRLASLQLAIQLLFLIGVLIAIGTFIEQDQALSFYRTNYPEANPILGFVTWKFILALQLGGVPVIFSQLKIRQQQQ